MNLDHWLLIISRIDGEWPKVSFKIRSVFFLEFTVVNNLLLRYLIVSELLFILLFSLLTGEGIETVGVAIGTFEHVVVHEGRIVELKVEMVGVFSVGVKFGITNGDKW